MRIKQFLRHQPKTYHDVGWSFPEGSPRAFHTLELPDGDLRLLDRRLHWRALKAAEGKLEELLRRTGRRTSQ
jgi:hypothetical protein